MPALGPKETATIAKHVYTLRTETDIQKAMKLAAGLGIRDSFAVDDKSRFTGSSGVLMFKKRSGFGYLAKGVGQRQGEALIVIRGTSSLNDWLTDANIGLQRGPSGWPVHAGFNDTFKSFSEDLRSFFKDFNPSHIHCIGHSLGGALATLTADALHQQAVAKVSLYTFGSPRVGAGAFSKHLTKKITADNVYRIYHDADPVSMIPIFPYSHLPDPGQIYHLQWSGARVAVPAHYMESYIKSIGDAGWQAIKTAPTSVNWENRIKQWLDSSASEGVLMFSAKTLWMISKALFWIMKEVAIRLFGTALTIGVTVLDQLASLLHQGVLASKKIAGYMASLLGKILAFLGRGAVKVGQMTSSFIRWVLDMLRTALITVAQRALSTIPIV